MKRLVALLILVPLAHLRAQSAPSTSPPLSDSAVRAIDAVFADFDRTDRPGCAIGVFRDDQTLYARGYGMANLEHSIALSPQSLFYMASVSKEFTAFTVALLADQGKLSLDDDVRKYIPELPDYGKTISVRHLVHHTSGLRDYLTLGNMAGWNSHDVMTEDQALALMTRQKALNFDPGSEHLYSNSGYVLLTIIVKRIT